MRRSTSLLAGALTLLSLSFLAAISLFFSFSSSSTSSTFSSLLKRQTPRGPNAIIPITTPAATDTLSVATSAAQQSPTDTGGGRGHQTTVSAAPSTSAAVSTSARTSAAQPTNTLRTTAAAPTTQAPTTIAVISATASTLAPSFLPSSQDPTPQTTLFATYSYSGYVPYGSASSGSVVTASPLSASSPRGFWHNKGAVGATFTFLILIALAIAASIAATVIKRRRRARRRKQRYLEKYNAAQARQANDASTDGHFEEPEPAVTEVMTPAPSDAYPDRHLHYGTTDMSQVDQGGYDGGGVGYILGTETDYASQDVSQGATAAASYQVGGYQQGVGYPQAAYQQEGPYPQAAYQQGRGYEQPARQQAAGYGRGYGQATQFAQHSSQLAQVSYPSTQQFNQPQNTRSAGLAPPVAARQTAARGNGYDQSIDSFYGAPAANDATHAV